MHLYDFLAPAYDPVFERIYRPYRTLGLERLAGMKGASVLDLACGTGQNFPFLAEKIGAQGKVFGVDISAGMLRQARLRVARTGLPGISLLQIDASQEITDLPSVDCIVCTYGFTSLRTWKAAFDASWNLLKPGGGYLIQDIDGQQRNFHTRAVEVVTCSDFSQKVWQPLQKAALDFRMDYIDPSTHLFGGRLFVAYGTKPH